MGNVDLARIGSQALDAIAVEVRDRAVFDKDGASADNPDTVGCATIVPIEGQSSQNDGVGRPGVDRDGIAGRRDNARIVFARVDGEGFADGDWVVIAWAEDIDSAS